MRRIPIVLLALGCGGEPPSTQDSTPPVVVYEPTWAGMQLLIADNCARCHPSVNGIDLVAELPNQTTATITGYLPWVTPGQPDQSWMWLLVSGQVPTIPMPADGWLPLETVDPIRVWIEDGAPFE